jgi:lipoprotein-anchoring transpeptidase ErfK/SrfK
MHAQFRSDWARRRAVAKAALAVPVIALGAAVLAAGCGTAGSPPAAAPPQTTGPPRVTAAPHAAASGAAAASHAAVAARAAASPAATAAARGTGAPKARTKSQPAQTVHLSATQAAQLPLATTYATTPTAPQDPAPFAAETGTVVHPTTTRVIYARPGGPAVAELPVTELGSPTWVPVVQSQPGWDRILLPTRPDRSTGWIYLGGGGLQSAYTPYQVDVDLAAYRVTILDAGRSLGSWTVAEGAPGTPTPTGRTFVLASLVPTQPTYSPLILPLGTHSDTLTTYGGGPGTVGLHGWPDASVFGHAVSHGCVRVPPAALRALSQVPLGSPVIITG